MPDFEEKQNAAMQTESVCEICTPELTAQMRRWRDLAASGWALAALAIAAMIVCIALPSAVPGFGPNSDSLEAQWEDFPFRYPDTREATWQPWPGDTASMLDSPAAETPTIGGMVRWSKKQQAGVMKIEGLASLDAHDAGHGQNNEHDDDAGHPEAHENAGEVYQIWIVDSRSDGRTLANRVLISGGTFEVPPHQPHRASHEAEAVIVPFHAAIEVRSVREILVTIEPRGGVWVSDLSRPVARALFEIE